MVNRFYPGAMHWLSITYEGEPQKEQIRPVLILHISGSTVYYYKITKRKGLAHQRRYRPFISNWKESGLRLPSYINLRNPPYEADLSDFASNSYIGDITQKDADEMTMAMNKLGY